MKSSKRRLLTGSGCMAMALLTLLGSSPFVLRPGAEELSGSFGSEQKGGRTQLTDQTVSSLTDISIGLFRLTAGDDANTAVSPLSALLCLSMLANGAEGETRAQLEKLFGMPAEDWNRQLRALTDTISDTKDCRIRLGSSVWLNRAHVRSIRPAFLQANAEWYGAKIRRAAFDEATRRDINRWVEQQTDGMVDSILEDIPSDTVLYLINTLLFNAKWQRPYADSEIQAGSFANADGTQAKVTMLHSEEEFYFETGTAAGFCKPYAGGRYSFWGILPNVGTPLPDWIAALNRDTWRELTGSLQRRPVTVEMPEFTCKSELRLNDALQAMGVNDLFLPDRCDLSGISPDGRLHCSEIRQKAAVEISRSGTKAAAVTWGNVRTTALFPPVSVVLNRPFVYAVVDQKSGLPLFLGSVNCLT